MIEALYEIGKLQPAGDLLNEIINDIGKDYKHVFKIVFEVQENNQSIYKEVGYEEFSSDKKLKYFYKKGSSRGCDKTPTSIFDGDIQKSFDNKITKVVDSFIKDNSIINNEFLDNLNEEVKGKTKIIQQKLNDVILSHNITNFAKEKSIITFTFLVNDQELYVGEIKDFINPFLENINKGYLDNYYSKKDKIFVRAKNKRCFLCKENASEVWGRLQTYKFYTIDKKCMVSSGFDVRSAWRNYPVCPNCTKSLERGKKYIENSENCLKLKFLDKSGFNFLLIPQLTIYNRDLLELLLKRIKQKYISIFDSKNNTANRVIQTEEKILEMLAEENNGVSFNFLFYEIKKSAYNILLHLQEVAPSRLKYLIDNHRVVDDLESRKFNIFKPRTIKVGKQEKEIDFNFSYQKIRDFFSKNDGDFDKDFLAIINDIFIGKEISFSFILKRIMDKLRIYFADNKIKDYSRLLILSQHNLNAYKILIYLEQIKLLNRRRFTMNNTGQPYQEFFHENSILDTETKRALFLEGVLAAKLLEIQGAQKKNRPFMARLNGLKIDGKIAQRLLPEMINKLEEYKSNGKRLKELETAIGIYVFCKLHSRIIAI